MTRPAWYPTLTFRAGLACTTRRDRPCDVLTRRGAAMYMRISPFAVLLAVIPACATAQGEPDSVQARNACRLAVQIVETGHPAPQIRWAHEFVANCGREGGRAVAGAIRRARSGSSPGELEAITRSIRTFRDGAVFHAALEVAGDRSASIPARVFAFRTLLGTMSPGRDLSYAEMTTAGTISACLGRPPGFHDAVTRGAPLPPQPGALLRDVAARVVDDASEAAEVRQAARCAARYADSQLD